LGVNQAEPCESTFREGVMVMERRPVRPAKAVQRMQNEKPAPPG